MPFRTCLTILIVLTLVLTGCMKAAAPPRLLKPPPVPPPPKVEKVELYDPEMPARYRDLLRHTPGSVEENVPLAFLAAADQLAAEGETVKALRFIDRAADGFARGKNPGGEATARSRKAVLLMNLGRIKEAQEQIQEVGEIWKDPPLKAFPGYLAGHLALRQGNCRGALEALKGALRDNEDFRANPYLLKLRRDAELDAGIAALLSDCLPGELAARNPAGTAEAASSAPGLEQLRAALILNQELYRSPIAPLWPAADFQKTEAEAHNFLGLVAWRQGDDAEAFRHLTQAGDLSRTAGFTAGEIRSLLFGAELGLRGEQRTNGRKMADLLRQRADSRGASPYRIWARFLLARYEEKEGRRREAILFLKEAAGIIESRSSAPKPEMLGEFSRRQAREVYESLVELLAAEGMAAEALRAAEAAKTMATVELLSGQEIGRTPAEREILQQETLLGEEIRGLQMGILHVSDDAIAAGLMPQLAQAEEAYRMLLGRIAVEAKNLHSLIAVRDVEPGGLQSFLDGNTTLFDYFATEAALYVWAIHRDRVHLERIEMTRAVMRELVFSFLAAIRDRDKGKINQLSRKAYDLLLKPIIPYVSGERIGFVTDDALTYLPFAALRYRGRFLAEGFSLFHLPEASLLQQVLGETRTSGMRILAFGNPNLENETLDLNRAPQEVERIRKRIGGTTVLLRQDATEEKAEDMSAGYDILHFAVRGQFLPDDILASGLLLTPDAGDDGRLTVREIFELRFGGRAVVLSGCDPLPQKDPEGKGLTALQRAFLSTGAPSVVSTLWLSDDKAVSNLLDFFYRQLDKKESLSDALRTAQLQMIRGGVPPYVWAAFVLTGRY